jgi:HNH endonuclease
MLNLKKMIKRQWTPEEEAYLIQNYPDKTASQIANYMKRSVGSIQQKAFLLGVSEIDRNGVTTNWTDDKIEFLKGNYDKMITERLCDHLGFSYTVVRDMMKKLGLRKCNHSKWTPEWDAFLKENYQQIGDVGLAKMFEEKFPKNYPWTAKHIGKRRGYLGLHRTKTEVSEIVKANLESGIYEFNGTKRWALIGQLPENTKRVWRNNRDGNPFIVIKINGKFHHYNRFVWEQHNGKIPKGMCIRHIDGDFRNNDISNLEMISRAENVIKNSGYEELTDKYIVGRLTTKNREFREILTQNSELIELQRNIYKAKRLCRQILQT